MLQIRESKFRKFPGGELPGPFTGVTGVVWGHIRFFLV